MRLVDYLEGFERDEEADVRHLAREKSYAITDHLEDLEATFDDAIQGDALFGSTAPSIFVGRHGYPSVSAGVMSPVGNEDRADSFATSGRWYSRGLDIEGVYRRRTSLLNSTRSSNVDVQDVWDGFVGTQREVAIADRPVDVEIGLDGEPDIDFDVEEITAPQGPRARARDATLAENPSVPREVEKTLEDDDWAAEGAMTYLYRRGFDVYEIRDVLSAGALGQGSNRRLVPTRWSITAVDDTVGTYLRGGLRNAPSVDGVEVHYNSYMGNEYWVILAPGNWEFELVELKAPGSIWNPDPSGDYYAGSDYEGYGGRTAYVEETAGAYHASRLGVLEHLEERDRQAKCLVVRHVSNEYWAPVGVWQIRESVRDAFDDEPGEAETFHDAVRTLAPQFPVDLPRLRRKSELVAGVQADLSQFG